MQEELIQVTAPVAGVVSSVNAKDHEGWEASPRWLFQKMRGFKVNLSVNESQISSIAVGQKAEITGVGFQGKSYTGTVTKISIIAQQVVSATGQETVVAPSLSRWTTITRKAWSGLKMALPPNVKIITSVDQDRIVVPYEAVLAEDSGQEYVYKVVETGR